MKNIQETPTVSVVIPMYNEQRYIGLCLDSLVAQDYPRERIEVLAVDGCSTDGSANIVKSYGDRHPTIRLLNNPDRVTPMALNIGIKASKGGVVIILGSHSRVAPDFIRRNAAALAATEADCVGGRIETVSDTLWGNVVSLAMSSPFGVGNARFRTSGKPGFVDTVAFGAYRREVFDRIGYFDEELVKNQDDEFNFRLTLNGGRIYLDPSIRCFYYSRPTLRGLWKQYFQYGRWKTRILRKHGRLPSGRHLVPSLALLIFATAATVAMAEPRFIFLPAALGGLYLSASLAVTLRLAFKNGPRFLLLPAAFTTLHLSYAAGFLSGLPQLLTHLSPKKTNEATR